MWRKQEAKQGRMAKRITVRDYVYLASVGYLRSRYEIRDRNSEQHGIVLRW